MTNVSSSQTSTRVFLLLTMMAISASLQHSTLQLFVAKLPGNKFYNGVLFGVAEVLSMLLSNMLLIYLEDIVAFKIVFLVGLFSYITLIVCSEIDQLNLPWLSYTAILTLIGSIGAMLNINLLIMELRVPPKNIAAV